jgi:hypothetical protein
MDKPQIARPVQYANRWKARYTKAFCCRPGCLHVERIDSSRECKVILRDIRGGLGSVVAFCP